MAILETLRLHMSVPVLLKKVQNRFQGQHMQARPTRPSNQLFATAQMKEITRGLTVPCLNTFRQFYFYDKLAMIN
jgi:hypothetical protein